MKIRTKFLLTTVIFGAMLSTIAGSVMITNQRVEQANAKKNIARNLERQANDLSYLSSAYLLYGESQQLSRWESRHASFSKTLAGLKPDTPEQRTVVGALKVNHERLKDVFIEARTSPARKLTQGDRGFIQVSWSRVQVQNQGLIFDTGLLEHMLSDRINELRQTNTMLMFALIAASSAFLLVNFVLTYRRTLASLALLHEGTQIIGSGNLDFYIAEKSNDEIGELSRAFNQMTADLKGVTASKVELEREITERKLAEAALAEERERLAVTLGSIGDGVIATDVDGKIVLLNGVAEQLTGWTQGKAAGRPIEEIFNIVNEITRKPVKNPVEKVLKSGKVVGLANHTVLISKDGTERSIADSCAPIRGKGGDILGVVLVFRDVTEESRLENERRLSKELSDALNDINAAITSTLDVDEIIDRAVVKAAQVLGCETAGVGMLEGDHWDVEDPIFELAAKAGKPVVVDEDLRSVLAVPLIVKADIIGVFSFNHSSTAVVFSEAQIDFATKLAVSVALALENARLYVAERKVAETLQETMLTMPTILPGLEFGHMYHSATDTAKVGGDFYDLFELGHDRVGILIGDVAGKGLEAAALTMLIKSTIKAYAHENFFPASIIAKTNELIIRATDAAADFVSVFFGVIDKNTGHLTYCSGGHPPAVLQRVGGGLEWLTESSTVIGVFENITFTEAAVIVEPGDRLILYTDGVTEARCESGFFGEEGLTEILPKNAQVSVAQVPQIIFNQILKHTGGRLADDIGLLAVGFMPPDINQ